MTKKDYTLIVKVLRSLPPIVTADVVATRFLLALEEAYPNFDREMFIKAL